MHRRNPTMRPAVQDRGIVWGPRSSLLQTDEAVKWNPAVSLAALGRFVYLYCSLGCDDSCALCGGGGAGRS